eukprot:3891098-Lingulodinium_polyedra.AAC.1
MESGRHHVGSKDRGGLLPHDVATPPRPPARSMACINCQGPQMADGSRGRMVLVGRMPERQCGGASAAPACR